MQLTIHITQVMQIKIKKVLIIPTLCTQTAIHSLHFVPSLRRAVFIFILVCNVQSALCTLSTMCYQYFGPRLQSAFGT